MLLIKYIVAYMHVIIFFFIFLNANNFFFNIHGHFEKTWLDNTVMLVGLIVIKFLKVSFNWMDDAMPSILGKYQNLGNILCVFINKNDEWTSVFHSNYICCIIHRDDRNWQEYWLSYFLTYSSAVKVWHFCLLEHVGEEDYIYLHIF